MSVKTLYLEPTEPNSGLLEQKISERAKPWEGKKPDSGQRNFEGLGSKIHNHNGTVGRSPSATASAINCLHQFLQYGHHMLKTQSSR